MLYPRDGVLKELGNPVHYLDFDLLILINKEVVMLTGEKHEFAEEDERKIRSLLSEVERIEVEGDAKNEFLAKASLLMYRIAAGQYFHEGNKRTALVAGLAFLRMNGYDYDIKDADLVAVVDRAGISTADLNGVQGVLRRLIRNV